ncbi:MAG: ATP-binding protein [Opitutales bacterium]|nr:ATP-binding protein [Opitutales bacterium]
MLKIINSHTKALLCVLLTLTDLHGLEIHESILVLEKQLEQAETVTERVDLLNNLAWHNIFGDPTKCKGYLDESIKLARAHKYTAGEAYAYDIWGSIFRVAGLYEEAIDSHLRSLKMNESINYEKGLAINYSNIGLVYGESGNDKDALEYHLQALDIKKHISDDLDGLFFTYNDIISALIKLDRFNEALEQNQAVIELKKARNEPGDLAPQFYNVANIQKYLGDLQKASNYLDLVEQQLELKRNHWIKIQSNILRAQILAEKQKLDQAISYGLQAYHLADKYVMSDFRRSSAGLLATIYAEKEDYENAYKYLQIQNQLQSESFGSNARTKTALIAAKYELEKEQSDLKNKYKLRLILGIIILSVLAILLLVSVWIVITINRKNNNLRIAYKEIGKQKTLIESQKQDLSELNSTKDKVFSIVAHDLRSPLASLGTLLDLFSRNTIGASEFRKMADELSKSVKTVNETLSQLLLWAKAQQHGISNAPQAVCLNEVTRQKIALFENTANLKQITLHNSVSPNHWAYVDEDQLRLILQNLINNALKFTNEKGKITISSSTTEDRKSIRVTVEDTGVGMDQEKLANLFKSSYNPSTRGTHGERGTGLGLVLCKEMIESNQGELIIESEAGAGSKFHFTLPQVDHNILS